MKDYGKNYLGFPKQKPGRKVGTGQKNNRFAMRISDGAATDLRWLQEHSQMYKGKSASYIVEKLITNAAFLQTLYKQ